VTPSARSGPWFHYVLRLPLITRHLAVRAGFAALRDRRYRRSANPVPSRTTHNTLIEVVWTLVRC
jgi:cytochrome c oxidase subunit 2